jgi:hypothetical protein
MHYSGDGKDSLITTDNFDDFAAVEQKIKQNREMVFGVKPPDAPRRSEKVRIENRAIVAEHYALLRK